MKEVISFFLLLFILITPQGLKSETHNIIIDLGDTATIIKEQISTLLNTLQQIEINVNLTEEQKENVRIQIQAGVDQLRQELQNIEIYELDSVEIIRDGNSFTVTTSPTTNSPNTNQTPYLGVYSSSISVSKARQLNYDYNYGTLITSVQRNTAAWDADIRADDIIMAINEIRVENNLSNVLSRFSIGETVTLHIFRRGEPIEIEMTLQGRNRDSGTTTHVMREPIVYHTTQETVSKKGVNIFDVGDGGVAWYPIWYAFDVSDVNKVISDYGFTKLNNDGLFFNGFGFKGNIDEKDFFIGFMYAWYSNERKMNRTLQDANGEDIPVVRSYRYVTDYWGISLDKRFALSANFLVSPGVMLGWASQRLQLFQASGFNQWDDISNHGLSGHSTYDKLNKSYILAQPRFEAMYRLVDWLSLRAEVGYMYGYSPYNGWKNKVVGDVYEVPGSPNTKYQGWSFSIGPWLGF